VLAQTWTHWELCIADDASTAPHVRAVLEEYARRDARIRLSFRPENGHISASSNSALELAHGEFFALLDHDDVLAPDALAWVAAEIDAHSDAELIYSDEDKIDEFGVRTSPYFKPAYNPELLRAQNCISHLGVFRTSRVREIGGFRRGFEGAQDWDLALRICDRTGPERIRHIPRVLYHWRAIQGSTALAMGEKPYVIAAQKRSIEEHFAAWTGQVFSTRKPARWGSFPRPQRRNSFSIWAPRPRLPCNGSATFFPVAGRNLPESCCSRPRRLTVLSPTRLRA
jgi:glycosyltransferase involved in cell wall biosynthesis